MDEQPVPFLGSVAVRAGRVTKNALRGPRFVRLLPDVYVPAGVPLDLATRSRAAYLLVDGVGALAGYSAAHLLGARCAPADADAEVLAPRLARRPARGPAAPRAALSRRGDRSRRAVGHLSGADRLRPGPSAAAGRGGRCGRRPGPRRGCPSRRGPRPERPLPRRAGTTAGGPGSGPGGTGCRIGHGNADPAGARPARTADTVVAARRVRPGRAVVARLDLAYPAAKVGVEYDGAQHRDRGSFGADLRRHNRLVALGWVVLRFTADDVLHRPDASCAQVAAALARRAA